MDNMITKTFEIRDRATFIPVVAIKMVPTQWYPSEEIESERYLLRRSGYNFDQPNILLCRMEASGINRNATYDPYSWGTNDRTFTTAHLYIEKNFDALPGGSVIDVEFILGETTHPKISERLET